MQSAKYLLLQLEMSIEYPQIIFRSVGNGSQWLAYCLPLSIICRKRIDESLQIDDSVSTIRTLRQRLCQLAQDEPEEFIVKMNLYADQLLQEKKIGNPPQKFIAENTSKEKSSNVP